MKKILCTLGIHSFRKFYTGYKFDDVVYLECRHCKKRTYEDTKNWNPKWRIIPLDNKWLEGKTIDPKFPYHKKPPIK